MVDESHMRFPCQCGVEYRIVPKEIPLTKDEVIVCECGRPIGNQGKYSTRYFDYQKEK
ncbi:hypothetical protein SAMN05444170_5083 [Bradyrhizobium erythrophlei]|uniref:Uncharacterized protein n=1 Tax=Bradyrhizobium erythrophlei TaxID=1437360 RepID=A0A1M7UH76_9BRAD|nr:hypothetical protein SAMN05444170_5083 [Bradyrhizobium erythrophlei]